MRVLHLTTHDEVCGVADYQAHFIAGMQVGSQDVEHVVWDLSPNIIQRLAQPEYEAAMTRFIWEAAAFDVVHVQVEWAFYTRDELARVVDGVHRAGKRVVLTIHTAPEALPDVYPPRRNGLSPRETTAYLRARRAYRHTVDRILGPIRRADLIIVHNAATADSLVAVGVERARIQTIIHPIRSANAGRPAGIIRAALGAGKGDTVLAAVGFVHRFKGLVDAVKALRLLPESYKLAVLGGVSPNGGDARHLDELADLILEHGLSDRVHITGYIQTEAEVDALVRDCDIAIYPYHPEFYSRVSSGALSAALANGLPVVVYPTATFLELAAVTDAVTVARAASYYELARSVREVVAGRNDAALAFAQRHSFEHAGADLVESYRQMVGSR